MGLIFNEARRGSLVYKRLIGSRFLHAASHSTALLLKRGYHHCIPRHEVLPQTQSIHNRDGALRLMQEVEDTAPS
jgi:hypothetical protein